MTRRSSEALLGKLGPWRSLAAVEIATMDWIDWYNNRSLLGSIGNISRRG